MSTPRGKASRLIRLYRIKATLARKIYLHKESIRLIELITDIIDVFEFIGLIIIIVGSSFNINPYENETNTTIASIIAATRAYLLKSGSPKLIQQHVGHYRAQSELLRDLNSVLSKDDNDDDIIKFTLAYSRRLNQYSNAMATSDILFSNTVLRKWERLIHNPPLEDNTSLPCVHNMSLIRATMLQKSLDRLSPSITVSL